MAERVAPPVAWVRVALIALLVVIAGVGGWELAMRAAGLTTTDIGDSNSSWARERRKVGIIPDQAVIVGSSRLLFDIDLPLWKAATGIAPIQLAIPGTTPRPMIADLARDPKFRGLLLIGYDPMIFFKPDGRSKAIVSGVAKEPLYKRSGLWLYDRLSGVFAYLDDNFRPMGQILRWRVPQRTVTGPFTVPWKLATTGPNRETVMWDRVENDAPFRSDAQNLWLNTKGSPPPPKPADLAKMIADVARDIAKIRARGGEVVFIRSPSDQPLLALEDKLWPRASTWDRLVPKSHGIGIYYADEPVLRDFHTVELSHLGHAERGPYTVAVLALLHRRLAERGEHLAGIGGQPSTAARPSAGSSVKKPSIPVAR